MKSKPEPINDLVNCTTNQTEIDVQKELDDEAKGTNSMAFEDDQLAHIRSATTVKSSWKAIKQYLL